MKLTMTAISSKIGSIGGFAPSQRILAAVRGKLQLARWRCLEGPPLLVDHYAGYANDAVTMVMTHRRCGGDVHINDLTRDALLDAAEIAKEQGLIPPDRELSVAPAAHGRETSFSIAEMEIEERSSEQFLFLTASGPEPGVFNLPLYFAFSGLRATDGFQFRVLDVSHGANGKAIELSVPTDRLDLAMLVCEPTRYVIQSVHSSTGEPVAKTGGFGGGHIAPVNPVLLVRTHHGFPLPSQLLMPLAAQDTHRWAHKVIMPTPLNTPASGFEELATATCAAFSMQQGKLSEPVDCFAHPFWNTVRDQAARKALASGQTFAACSLEYLDELGQCLADGLRALPSFAGEA